MTTPSLRYTYGIHACAAAIKALTHTTGCQLMLLEGRLEGRLWALSREAEFREIPVVRTSKEQLQALSGSSQHQGVILAMSGESSILKDWSESDLPELLQNPKGRAPLILVLDQITDPHNLGACLRTADGAGVDCVIVPKDHSAKITPAVEKVASGAAHTVPLIAVTNLARTLETLKNAGVWLVGMAGEAESLLYEIDLQGPIALLMGSEGEGLRRLTKSHADYLAKLPMQGSVSSLNVSVATGIALYECVRQRGL